MASYSILVGKVYDKENTYQLAKFCDNTSVEFYEQSIAQLAQNVSDVKDFSVENGLLYASPKLELLGGVNYKQTFSKCIIDLFEFLVKSSARLYMPEDSHPRFMSLKISNSTMTVYIPYVTPSGWKSKVLLDISDIGLTLHDFDFLVESKVPEDLGDSCNYKGELQYKDVTYKHYSVNKDFIIAPLVEPIYEVFPPILHYLCTEALSYTAVNKFFSILERQVLPFKEPEEQLREYTPRSRPRGVVLDVKNIDICFNNTLNFFLNRVVLPSEGNIQVATNILKEAPQPRWREIAGKLFIDFRLLHTSPEDRLAYLFSIRKYLSVCEILYKLELYKHRCIIQVNGIPLYIPESEFPVSQLYLYGGTSQSLYKLRRVE